MPCVTEIDRRRCVALGMRDALPRGEGAPSPCEEQDLAGAPEARRGCLGSHSLLCASIL